MLPEQALGEVDRLDERSEVFGMGVILCEILTASWCRRPPQRGVAPQDAESADPGLPPYRRQRQGLCSHGETEN